MFGCRDADRVAALARVLAARSDASVVGAWPLEEAVAAGRHAGVAAVVLDGYPSSLVLRSISGVTRDRPELGVLVLGPVDRDVDVLIVVASGASGYLPSNTAHTEVANAVEALWRGETVLPSAASLAFLQLLRRGGRGIVVSKLDGGSTELTHREWEVLVLLRQGCTTREIARQYTVSTATVRSHVAALVHKLGARDRAALAVSPSAALTVTGHRPLPLRNGQPGSNGAPHPKVHEQRASRSPG